MGNKTDLKHDINVTFIPALQKMLEKEEIHCTLLKTFDQDTVIDRLIDLSMDSARLFRQRISAYQKYSSELK